ncbi:tetratricopeptide repeat protein [Algoriphagus sp. CAU 1675]|uniref:type IX secretion system periplasmic lipoprotein PorW/SprE n=1 Tax=Algoriphagus sp. CAU 1675 TaxID=3032597 RepID=UPI0023DBDC1D|nr:tetratricopeptide repeat protein [Algoriphagus sp. CAU 1675]MDF2158874.1 tetratricopeptide repeat protein [Algoriphagus sp. CAU 1675]
MSKFSRLSLVILFLAGACSSERNTFTNRAFHNLTSHYNAYYLADVKIKEVEAEVKKNFKEDYTQILPVFIPYDSSTIQANSEKLQSARELASKAIEWHRISKWVDDSYFLLGKIDYLQSHFDDAQNTFKYVNVNSKDKELRHQALVSLLKLYVDLGEFEKANFTIDYLSKESGISDENRYELYRTLAYYYENRADRSGVIGALDKAIEYSKDAKEASRINFILAQRYQREGLDALAYDFYKKAQEGNPPYERSFYAQLYAQQVAELNASKDLRKVRNYYEDLYKDPKNKDLKDVVVYERALFEEKQGDLPLTLDLLHQAAKEPGSNPRLKGYIYQKLAQINLNEFQDYRATKYYLDSALTFIKEDDPVALEIADQKTTLDQFVFHFERIQANDSLLRLSKLSKEEQELVAMNFIEAEEERLLEEARAKEKPKSSSIFDNLLAFSDRGSGSSFYFDNAMAMQQGSIDFYRTWGNRPLQDNWRRSAVLFQNQTLTPEETESDSTALEEENNPLNQLPSLESLLANIPRSPEALNGINLELEESYFELGKLLYFELKETEQSIDNLETLVREYPNSNKKPEAYYLLYLGQKELNGNFQQYVGRLNSEFPESRYTFSVNNPDAASGNLAYLESSKNYEKAYNDYYGGNYTAARQLIKTTLEQFPLTRNTERLLLLDIMITGKTEAKTKYRERLETYIENSKDEALVELARNMLMPLLSQEELANLNPQQSPATDSTAVQKPITDSTAVRVPLIDSPFKLDESQTHIVVLHMTPDQSAAAQGLVGALESFHTRNFSNARLRTGNMNMNRETAIFIISPFNNAEKAREYYNKFMEEFESDSLPEEVKKNAFFISIENFQVLNRTKNIEEYRAFFEANLKTNE